RGLGHRTATGFLNLADGRRFSDKPKQAPMQSKPVLLDMDSELGTMYYQAMQLDGKYAYAGRDVVINQVLDVLGAKAMEEIHNHHNHEWNVVHSRKEYIYVRKGLMPDAQRQKMF